MSEPTPGFPGTLPLRPIAILVMIVGVAGFVAARVLFAGQLVCLVVSTLVTFGGLLLIIAGRRYGWGTGRSTVDESAPSSPRAVRSRELPRGLRYPDLPEPRTQQPLEEVRAPAVPRKQVIPRPEPQPPGTLLSQVINLLRMQGARVEVETHRENRTVLRIESEGQAYLALVREDLNPIDVAEVRGLFALVENSGSERGYLIAAGQFTPNSYEWAKARPKIRLVGQDELDELSI